MTNRSLTTVEFHGATLLTSPAETPEATLVAMKPVVEGMKLDWGGQHKKLLAHPVLSQGVSVMEIPSDGGLQEATALPLTRLNFWMATIHPNRIKDQAVRDAVIRYQVECADTLFAHFFGRQHVAHAPIEVMEERPWHERPAEDRRLELATIAAYGRYGNHSCAWWYAMTQAKMPRPPRRFQPAWWQSEIDMPQPVQDNRAMVVVQMPGGRA
ncbi:phage antirepressor N-terminal domain-containing protein [Pararoseomonas indoligenes]|uniref:Antirepressor protein ant N-terminal domain-containing protein n=1 Tax=Roseomonas indoligenes TaxID=2820811 RepID=A0A940S4N9_9PROT|nr:phage antirepressor N-terminal domain-containing protein [Pararoseomonas indoligenes]MBP0492160.1 hypothetical protein [Pararoseomonas indoligenes]